MTDFWTAPTHSEFFNARYDGHCPYPDCYKRGDIEQGDGCEYLNDVLMHMRCARAAERAHKIDDAFDIVLERHKEAFDRLASM